jgi:16S rRNA (cytidine1402-2'-O)-methyltransferase
MAKLSLVTLPIGNISDLTTRARQLLEQTRRVICEDTRSFKQFCNHANISTDGKELYSFHDHSQSKVQHIISMLDAGDDLLLVSDAGSPIISDPAYPLVKKVVEETDHKLETAPGVCSVITALELSGLPPHPFTFHGFLPREDQKKETLFESLGKGTHIFFESPHRSEKTLRSMHKMCRGGTLSMCRELTKKFESVYRIELDDTFEESIKDVQFVGEVVLVLYIPKESEALPSGDFAQVKQLSEKYLREGGSPKKLAKILSMASGIPIKESYDLLSKNKKK